MERKRARRGVTARLERMYAATILQISSIVKLKIGGKGGKMKNTKTEKKPGSCNCQGFR